MKIYTGLFAEKPPKQNVNEENRKQRKKNAEMRQSVLVTARRKEAMRAPMALLLFLLLLLAATIYAAASSPPLNDDILALVVFKSSVDDPIGALSSWSEDDDSPCGWLHVQCDPRSSRVSSLSLSFLSLSGRLPRSLLRLPSLRSLSLSNNNLSGDIPSHLSLLPRLAVLDLSLNQFTGIIPDELGSITSLRYLDLSGNELSGPMPQSLFSSAGSCSSLRYLDLSGNRLEGPVPETLRQCRFLLHLNFSDNQLSSSPKRVWELSRLRAIDLSRNSFSGDVPESIAKVHNLKVLRLAGNQFSGSISVGVGLCPHLNTIDLGGNAFTGAPPSSMQYLRELLFLNLASNSLSGELPSWFGNLSMLQHLDLSDNKITGSIPDSIGNLKELSYLSLSGNSLAGVVPESLSGCSKLTELRLGSNELNGSIPRGLFDLGLEVVDLSSNKLVGPMLPGTTRLSENLQFLDLSNNKFKGVIPLEGALYFNLRYLNLSGNGLRSRLPPELGSFRNLSVLDLRRSELYGPIPEDLCDSGSLTVLQLDGNALTGPVPEDFGNCSSLYLLSLSHNALSGSIPASITKLKKLEILNLEFNNFSGELPPELGELENLLAVNISHNRLIGRLPAGGIFPSLDQSALQGNLGLCSPLVAEPCRMNVPKPLVLDPNAYRQENSSSSLVTSNTMSPAKSKHRRFLSVSTMVAITAALVIVLGVLLVSLLNVSARRRLGLLENALESMCSSSSKSGGPAVGKMVVFSPRASNLRSEAMVGGAEALLTKATEIGRGIFGTTYKAVMGDGRAVAIKKLTTENIIQFHDDFDREVRALGKARHSNLVPLKGYYWTPELQLLITDYAPHGSLNERLHGGGGTALLHWPERFKIALGIAKGLCYLHQSFRPAIIHYDLKPSNILLDEHCNPKVSDFGLARLLPKLEKHVASNRFQTAMGYMAPEMACQSLRVNEKCDVYGFGVLLLELVTGRRPVEYGEDDVVVLVEHVRARLENGEAAECVDVSMGEFPEEEVLPVMKLGLVCTSQIPSSRPSMAEVVQILQVIKTPVVGRMEAI